MAWKAVGPVVQKVVSRIVDVGEGSVAAEPRRLKRAASTKPAAKSFRETNVTEGETTLQIQRTGPHRTTAGVDRHIPKVSAPPLSAGRRLLLVWDREAGGTNCRVSYATQSAGGPDPGLTPNGAFVPETAPARRQAREVSRLKLVGGTDHHAT